MDSASYCFSAIADMIAGWFPASEQKPNPGSKNQPPIDLGEIDENDPDIRWSPTYEYMSAMCNILDDLTGKTKAEKDELVFAEMRRCGWA